MYKLYIHIYTLYSHIYPYIPDIPYILIHIVPYIIPYILLYTNIYPYILVIGGGGGGDGLAARPAMKLLGKSENGQLSQYKNT